MALAGVTTDNISNRVSVSDEIIVNRENSTGLQAVADFAIQLAASGAVADAIEAASGKWVSFATKAAIDADLSWPENTEGRVYNDVTPANKGVYTKSGASGVGAWTRVGPLPEGDTSVVQAALDAEIADRTGLINPPDLSTGGASVAGLLEVTEDFVPGYGVVFLDMHYRIFEGVTNIGKRITADNDDTGSPVIRRGARWDVNHMIGTGQSWKGGVGGSGTAALSTVSRLALIMFNGGIRAGNAGEASTDPATVMASFVPAVESLRADGVRGETPMFGAGAALLDRVSAELGLTPADQTFQVLLSQVAPGGIPFARLTKGDTYYPLILEEVTRAYSIAQSLGQTYGVVGMPLMIGKGDYDAGPVDRAAWAARLLQWRADLDADIKAIVPHQTDIKIFPFQTGSHGHDGLDPNVDLAIIDAAKADANIVVAGPMYYGLRAASDSTHFASSAYKTMGGYAGLAIFRAAIDEAAEGGALMEPVEGIRQGKVVTLRYEVAAAPLVLDTALVSNPGNYGFALVDGRGAAIAISSVALAGPDRVRIVAATDVPAGARVRYAWSGAYAVNSVSGPRGCLRDSQGDTLILDPGGSNIPAHNWGTLFELTLS